jgi:hypothetical protein
MAEIHVKRLPSQYNPLFEDAMLSNNRLFIGTNGHDTTTLAPLFQKNWHFNYNDQFTAGYADDNWGIMYLEKGTIQAWSDTDSGSYYDNNMESTYNVSLDWNYYPVKRMWKTINNRILTNSHYSHGGNNVKGSANQYNFLYPTTDITAGSGASSFVQAANQITHYCYEDVSNQRMWGLCMGGSNGDYWVYNTQYETTVGSYGTVDTPGTYCRNFFMGVDDQGFIHAVGVSDYSSNYSQYFFYKIHPTTYTRTDIISSSFRSNTSRTSPKSWPSNIRRQSSTRRVLYSSHYDTNSVLAPIRYVWNPADGTIVATNCTMTYSGANTYATYSSMYSTEGSTSYNYYSWHMKPYQFTVNGVNYITFWLTDKFAQTNSGPSRWSTAQKRTMMTYTIGAGTGDDVMTYHSSYTFPTINDIPKDFMPINSAGTQLMVPVTLQMKFFSFNESTGWAPTGTYPYEFRMVGLDQTNRIWGFSREKSNGVVHMITPTIPVTINVVMASSSFTFTGSNISTSCTVDAYGSDGLRISTSVNLAIDGGTMLFTTNSTKNLTVTTSASASTVVNLTITGGGVNNIIASVDI